MARVPLDALAPTSATDTRVTESIRCRSCTPSTIASAGQPGAAEERRAARLSRVLARDIPLARTGANLLDTVERLSRDASRAGDSSELRRCPRPAAEVGPRRTRPIPEAPQLSTPCIEKVAVS